MSKAVHIQANAFMISAYPNKHIRLLKSSTRKALGTRETLAMPMANIVYQYKVVL